MGGRVWRCRAWVFLKSLWISDVMLVSLSFEEKANHMKCSLELFDHDHTICEATSEGWMFSEKMGISSCSGSARMSLLCLLTFLKCTCWSVLKPESLCSLCCSLKASLHVVSTVEFQVLKNANRKQTKFWSSDCFKRKYSWIYVEKKLLKEFDHLM